MPLILRRLNLSQEPQLMRLQARLHEMLTAGEEMPGKAAKSVERQLEELRKAAQDRVVLIVLDGGRYTQQPSLCRAFHFCMFPYRFCRHVEPRAR